jgi:hypothetical protein
MSASEQLFCFTSNKIDVHPCPNCRAPMLVRIKPAGPGLSVRAFECFNCDDVVVIPGDHLSLRAGAGRSMDIPHVRHSKNSDVQ